MLTDLGIERDRITRLEGRLKREHLARVEAENILEAKSLELFQANEKLKQLAASLELRVEERTRQLSDAHRRTVELAERDILTGLDNRARFTRVAQNVLDSARHNKSCVAFAIIDIDFFKEINDSLGHEVGDAVLQHVASQFQSVIRETDTVARLGGDEFCAIFPAFGDLSNLVGLIERMSYALRAPLVHRGKSIVVNASVGYAVFPDHGNTLDDVMRHADLALYRSKAAGRGICTAFDQRMSEEVLARHRLETDLRAALTYGGLEPWFQPIIDLTTGRPGGAEALVRWRREDGITLPGAFLHVLEDCGLMPNLFEKILRASLRFAKPHIDRGDLRYITVNVSPSQFKFETLCSQVAAALDVIDYPPQALVLEITEDVLLADLDRAHNQLSKLAGCGIKIALDDFGNGYANIGYLLRLPIHILKLDRSLTVNIAEDPKALSVVGAVAELAHVLGLTFIAEGIENSAQAQALRDIRCQHVQGYLFAPPMSCGQFATYLGKC